MMLLNHCKRSGLHGLCYLQYFKLSCSSQCSRGGQKTPRKGWRRRFYVRMMMERIPTRQRLKERIACDECDVSWMCSTSDYDDGDVSWMYSKEDEEQETAEDDVSWRASGFEYSTEDHREEGCGGIKNHKLFQALKSFVKGHKCLESDVSWMYGDTDDESTEQVKVWCAPNVKWAELRAGAGGSRATTRKREEREQRLMDGLRMLLLDEKADREEECEEEEWGKEANEWEDWTGSTGYWEPDPDSKPDLLATLESKIATLKRDGGSVIDMLKELIEEHDHKENRCYHETNEDWWDDDWSTWKSNHKGKKKKGHWGDKTKPNVGSWSADDEEHQRKEEEKTRWRRSRLALSTWSKGDIMSASKVMEAIQVGEAPHGKLAVVSVDEAREFRELAEIHREEKTMVDVCFALVIDPNDVEEVNELSKIPGASNQFVEFEAVGPKKTWILPLRSMVPAFKVARVREVKTGMGEDEEELSAIRVIATQECFDDFDKLWRNPERAIAHLNAVKEIPAFRSYGWRSMTTDERGGPQYSVVGYIKCNRDVEEKVLKLSGSKGVILRKVGEERKKVWWIKRDKQEKAKEYLDRVIKEAANHRAVVTWRRGGNADLGLVGVEAPASADAGYASYVAKGTPRWWSPDVVKQWLEKQGFTVRPNLSAPKTRWQGWLFGAKAPQDFKEDVMNIYMVGGSQVTIQRWYQSKPKVDEDWLWRKSKWHSGYEDKATTSDVFHDAVDEVGSQGQAKKEEQIKPEVVVVSSQNSAMDETKQKRTREEVTNERTNEPKNDKEGKRQKGAKEELCPTQIDRSIGPGGFKIFDAGTNGSDCGFRAMAAAVAMANGKSREETVQKLTPAVKSLRAGAAKWLTDNQATVLNAWVPGDTTEVKEGGPIPKNKKEFLEAVKRETRWICGYVLKALAAKSKTKIVVFVWQEEKKEWQRSAVFDGGGKTIIPLLLRSGHYVTVIKEKDKAFPQAWIKDWDGQIKEDLRGKGASSKADEEEDLDDWLEVKSKEDLDDITSWMEVKSNQGSKKKEASVMAEGEGEEGDEAGPEGKEESEEGQKRHKVETWKCPCCPLEIKCKGGVRRNFLAAVQRHFYSRHAKEFKSAKSKAKKEGRKNTGLGVRQVLKPVIATNLPESARDWTCWVCKLGLPFIEDKWLRDQSRAIHMKKHKIEPRKAYFKKQKAMQGSEKHNMAKWTARYKEEKAKKSFEKMKEELDKVGHDMVKEEIVFPETASRRKRPFITCRKCRIRGEGAVENERKCGLPKQFASWDKWPRPQWWAKFTTKECRSNKLKLVKIWNMSRQELKIRDKETKKIMS
eukprot:TRINITY_DN15187_c0_g1_i2.p1 TRINITY_DN15187_c0_g1~~TRINITY_DN15187_c0_g1_i2.p1  ORF type:complete len:1309 (+),score=143.51 TRINITY_DN15187_c0_g1_i2:215-4141(+)